MKKNIWIIVLSFLIISCSDTKDEATLSNNNGEIKKISRSNKGDTFQKWINPSIKNCIKNGGVIMKNDDGSIVQPPICKARWNGASYICQDLNARLPKIDDFIKLIEECGGKQVLIEDTTNIKNSSYQKCMHSKGFYHSYWSTLTDLPDEFAWIMIIENGTLDYRILGSGHYVKCIK